MFTNYTTLVQAVKDSAEDDGAEFSSYIDTAIGLAEERLFRELIIQDLETEVTGALTAYSSTITKPSGYRISNYVSIVVNGARRLLQMKTDEFLIDYWPNTSIYGVPKYYSDSAKSYLSFAPVPDAGYTYYIKCYKKPSGLSNTNASNYYVERLPDVLFAAVMVEMHVFMKHWDIVALWEQKYQQAKESWTDFALRQKRDDGPNPGYRLNQTIAGIEGTKQ